MEDARFVRFVDDDGSVTYYATYTAYDGSHISQQLLETTDFRSFTSSPLVGAAAANKGLALFPRRIGGRFAALSRCDRETNSVAFADDLSVWTSRVAVPAADRGVGGAAARKLRFADRNRRGLAGADPRCRADAHLQHRGDPARPRRSRPGCSVGCGEPLLSPARATSRTATCPTSSTPAARSSTPTPLVIPYGIGDSAIGIATAPLHDLLAEILDQPESD